MPRGKGGFACPLYHVCEMFICLEFFECHKIRSVHAPRGGGVLPYMGYMGMCRCEGYVFQAVYSRIGYINQGVWV